MPPDGDPNRIPSVGGHEVGPKKTVAVAVLFSEPRVPNAYIIAVMVAGFSPPEPFDKSAYNAEAASDGSAPSFAGNFPTGPDAAKNGPE
jgi:hypothetical protein